MGTIMHVRHIETTLAVPLLLCAQAVCTQLDKEQSLRSRTVDKQVAALIEKMLSKTTERRHLSNSKLLDVQRFLQLSSAWMTGEAYPTRTLPLGINHHRRSKK